MKRAWGLALGIAVVGSLPLPARGAEEAIHVCTTPLGGPVCEVPTSTGLNAVSADIDSVLAGSTYRFELRNAAGELLVATSCTTIENGTSCRGEHRMEPLDSDDRVYGSGSGSKSAFLLAHDDADVFVYHRVAGGTATITSSEGIGVVTLTSTSCPETGSHSSDMTVCTRLRRP